MFNASRLARYSFFTCLHFVLIFMLSVFTSAAQSKNPYYVKQLESAVHTVEITTSGGGIQIVHDAGEQNRVEVYIKSNNGKELSRDEIESRLKSYYDLTIETSGSRVKATARTKKGFNNWKDALSISFKVFVPQQVETDLKTSGGSIKLQGISGKQAVMTSGGSIDVERVSGKINGATSGGSISLKTTNGEIDLSTSGGSISAYQCEGTIELATSGGSLQLENLKGNIDAHTSGGSISAINISGDFKTGTSGGSVKIAQMRGSVDATTSGGNMDVTIAELGKFIKLNNSAGNIQLKLPADKGINLDARGSKVSIPQLTNFSGNASETQISGKMNGGGVPVNVKTGSGRVSISF